MQKHPDFDSAYPTASVGLAADAPHACTLSPRRMAWWPLPENGAGALCEGTSFKPKAPRWAAPLLGQHGGAAVEYVLVTTFATLLSIAALAYVGSLVKERLAILAQRLGSEAPLPDFDVMGDSTP